MVMHECWQNTQNKNMKAVEICVTWILTALKFPENDKMFIQALQKMLNHSTHLMFLCLKHDLFMIIVTYI